MYELLELGGGRADPRRFGTALALGLAIVLGVTGTARPAGVYKWVDEHGKVHYGDRPPVAAESKSVDIEAPPEPAAGDADRKRKTLRLLDAFENERAREAAEAARAKAEAARRQSNCDASRRRVAMYERANTLFARGNDGERVYLNEGQRAEALARAREHVRQWCR